ncbi:DUF2207 domain-containing protein [Sphingomicrobium nitratireducens]|uniref:DUF2207 domain-containing protein n=1 Tax=Sphingomicrobium nitratireducens TaxID=2964666 RepID=UPI00223F1AC2
MRAFVVALAAFAALLLGAAPALADERIESFHSRLELAPDGQLTVTETIRVQAEGIQIRRGIYRDLPTRYRGKAGENVKVGFTLLGTERDGQVEPSKIERMANGVRIRIGDADRYVSRGSHVYRIRYSVRRAVGFFDEFDELYWNVTGTGWGFAIDQASATLVLPEPVKFGQVAMYTGVQGSTANDARIVRNDPGELKVETTRPLGPREGLTVAAAFPKGVIAPPSSEERAMRRLADFAPPIAAVLGLVLVVAYYLWAYFNVGRDPRPGTIVPLFAPPDGLSPAAIRYVVKQSMDNRGFAAAMVEAGVKGHVRLEDEGGGFFKSKSMTIHRSERGVGQELADGEERMLIELLSPGTSLEVKQEHHAKFSSARKALDRAYAKQFEGKAFHRNLGWAFAGLLALFAALGLVAAAIVWSEDLSSPLVPMLTVATLLIAMLLLLGAPDKGQPGRTLVLVLGGVVALVAGAMSVALLPLAFTGGGAPLIMLMLVPASLIAISGFFWMSAPTMEGRALLDRIAGFKRYLSTTERERFNRMQPAGEDLKLFERFLPYAIALGVEHEWAEHFEGQIAAASLDPGQRDNGFVWYSGHRSVWDNPGGFAKAIGGGLSASIASAATAPGSSSGSGGGGFSGGGGGGGGGGGW